MAFGQDWREKHASFSHCEGPVVIAKDPSFCRGLKQSHVPRDCFVGLPPDYLLAVTG